MGMMLWPLLLAVAGNAAQSVPHAEPAQARVVAGFLIRELEFQGERHTYSIYVPPEYTPERAWPAILFLHGSGERGKDGLLQTEVGIGTAIRRHRDYCPAIVVMPQCRPDKWWADAMSDMALQCLDETAKEYRIDSDRVYLTGLSLGGFGTWTIAQRAADRFAAIVPICGFVGQPNQAANPEALKKLAGAVKSMPIWCFHGAKDRAVSVERAKELVAAIRAAGGDVKYTEFPNGEHNVWDLAYGDRKLWEWLLAQKRVPASQPAKPRG